MRRNRRLRHKTHNEARFVESGTGKQSVLFLHRTSKNYSDSAVVRIGRTNLVHMKRLSFSLLCFVFAAAAVSTHAQVAPAAYSSGWSLSAGGEGSAFQPDYADEPCCAEASPNRLYGIGAYVDMRFTRWVQVEGEARWMRFNQDSFGTNPPVPNGETVYQIGPRIPIHTWGKFTPYGKALWGLASADFLTGDSTVLTFGGGLDYRLNRKFTLRAFDFEYQRWNVSPTLYPYGGSVGLSYRIF